MSVEEEIEIKLDQIDDSKEALHDALGVDNGIFARVGQQLVIKYSDDNFQIYERWLLTDLGLTREDFVVEKKDFGFAGDIVRIWRGKGRQNITLREAIGTFLLISQFGVEIGIQT